MNFLSTQPTDAAIWEKLGSETVEPAVQEEQEENSARVNDDGCFWFQLWRGERLEHCRCFQTDCLLSSCEAAVCHVYLLPATCAFIIYTDKQYGFL